MLSYYDNKLITDEYVFAHCETIALTPITDTDTSRIEVTTTPPLAVTMTLLLDILFGYFCYFYYPPPPIILILH